MIYQVPVHSEADDRALARIEELRRQLRHRLHIPRQWHGTLRRVVQAAAVQGSNSIEGYTTSVENAAAIIDGEAPDGPNEETRQAILGYQEAMTYALRVAPTGSKLNKTLLKALHYMMLKHNLDKNPGEWRPGAVWVEDAERNLVYEGPEQDRVDGLMADMLVQSAARGAPPMVTAAMAHLNLTLIHPFSDGNGRMARCAQSFVLAAEGESHPWFASIEEHLGYNTAGYYEVLSTVAHGSWSPERSARPWVTFVLDAHEQQVQRHLRRIQATEALWDACERLAAQHRLPSRVVGPICDAARGWRLHRSLYAKVVTWTSGDDISAAMATRDLSALVDAGLLHPKGEKRGRTYEPTPALTLTWQEIMASIRSA